MADPVRDDLDLAIQTLSARLKLEIKLRNGFIISAQTPMPESSKRVLAQRDSIISNLTDALQQLLNAEKLVKDVLNRTSRDQWSPDPRI